MFSFLWLATGSLRELFQTLNITVTINFGMHSRFLRRPWPTTAPDLISAHWPAWFSQHLCLPLCPRRISCCVDSRVRYCADSRPTHKKADCDPRDPSRNHWCLWRGFPLLNGAPDDSTGTEKKVYYAPLLTRE